MGTRDRIDRRGLVLSFLLVTVVFIASPNSLHFGDGYLSTHTAHSLLHDRDAHLGEFLEVESVAGHYGLTHVAGRPVDYFPWMAALPTVPVIAAVDAVAAVGLGRSAGDRIRSGADQPMQRVATSVTSAIAALVLALLARRVLELAGRPVGPGGVGWLTLAAAFATPLWSVTSRAAGQHAPAVALLGGALLLMLAEPGRRVRRTDVLAGGLAASAVWVRPSTLVITIVVVGAFVVYRRGRSGALLAGFAATHLMVVGLNLLVVGTAMPPYFSGRAVGRHPHLVEALAANLLSPARGLFVYCPFVLLAVAVPVAAARGHLPAAALRWSGIALVATVGQWVVVSGFGENWVAGITYGPRFMIETLTLLFPLGALGTAVLWGAAGSTPRLALRLLVVAVWAFPVLVHAQGGVLHGTDCWNREPVSLTHDPARIWSVARPQFLAGFADLADHGGAAVGRRCDSYGA